jgi:hypothetical protein
MATSAGGALMVHSARDIVYLGAEPAPQPAAYLSDESIASALMRLQVMEAAQSGARDIIVHDPDSETPEQKAERDEACDILHAACAELLPIVSAMLSDPSESIDMSAAAAASSALSLAQSGLLNARSKGTSPSAALASAKAVSIEAGRAVGHAQNTSKIEHGVEMAEKFQSYSAEFQQHIRQFESWYEDWDVVQDKNFAEISTLASELNVDISGASSELKALEDQIAKETDPVKKSQLVLERAKLQFEVAEKTHEAAQENGTPEQQERAQRARDQALAQLEEAAEEAKKMQAAAEIDSRAQEEVLQERLALARDHLSLARESGDPTIIAEAQIELSLAQARSMAAAAKAERGYDLNDSTETVAAYIEGEETASLESKTAYKTFDLLTGFQLYANSNSKADQAPVATEAAEIHQPIQSSLSSATDAEIKSVFAGMGSLASQASNTVDVSEKDQMKLASNIASPVASAASDKSRNGAQTVV